MSAAPTRVAEVDLGAITANVRRLRSIAGTRHHMAVVKADGYGHGAVAAARAAQDGGADWLGVADVDEALALRAAGVDGPILAWLHGADADFAAAAAAGVDLGVSSRAQLQRVAATAPGAAVQVKLDTGLSRNGVAPEAWADVLGLAAALEREQRVRVRGVFSHLANTSPDSDAAAEQAFAEGLRLARDLGLDPELVHLAATAAALRRDQAGCTMVRTGIGVYGLSPFGGGEPVEGLRPAMTLRAEVAATRRVPAGTGVSYDHTWRADRATNLALVPVGYADGIPRSASNRAEVTVAGRRRPVRGRIAMDQLVVDLGDDEVRVGEPVTVFGDPVTGVPGADEWADWAGTINYEIVTRIGPRVARSTVGR